MMDIEELEVIARALYRKPYICPGPSRLVKSRQHGVRGIEMTIASCLVFPDCGCRAYDEAVDEWEEAREKWQEAKREATQ